MTLYMSDKVNVEKGREEERKNIIIKMIKQGFTDSQIISVCDTSIEEIEDCKKSI